jgi:hypothetical protein
MAPNCGANSHGSRAACCFLGSSNLTGQAATVNGGLTTTF